MRPTDESARLEAFGSLAIVALNVVTISRVVPAAKVLYEETGVVIPPPTERFIELTTGHPALLWTALIAAAALVVLGEALTLPDRALRQSFYAGLGIASFAALAYAAWALHLPLVTVLTPL